MRLVRYQVGGSPRFGSVEGDDILGLPATTIAELVGATSPAPTGARTPEAEAELLSPVDPLGRNLFCVGWNYQAHFEEGRGKRGTTETVIPDRPAFFSKSTGTLIGPNDPIEAHGAVTDTLDWEVELAVVIGRGGRDIAEADAAGHVLGYSVANDISARNVQRDHGGQWFRGKSLDATCPVGPWIITPDELEPLGACAIRCRVNGELVQDATLGDMHFGVPRIIAELSRGLTLKAGDVILTGTPPGVGFARTPPRFLAVGDVVESEIEGIGVLRNEVIA
jgi:2-keto-4-pentenoate hydratase/2-oxohepta-3-ene-1,7-dioic acid hydratase in catechol pathway